VKALSDSTDGTLKAIFYFPYKTRLLGHLSYVSTFDLYGEKHSTCTQDKQGILGN
jgi:hypothetical protein